jgi:hypothetical protein
MRSGTAPRTPAAPPPADGIAPARRGAGAGDAFSTPAPVSSAPGTSKPAWARGLRLASLRELEARQAHHPPWPTGHGALDRDLGGGLVRGTLTECAGAVGSLGLTGLQHQLLLAARQTPVFTALIDAGDRFDPGSCPAALRAGLLWVRGDGTIPQALKAADLLARDPNFGLLLLDLREAEHRALRRVPAQQWYRLQQAVRESDALLVAFTPFPTIAAAGTRLAFSPPPAAAPEAEASLLPPAPLHWEILRHPGTASSSRPAFAG